MVVSRGVRAIATTTPAEAELLCAFANTLDVDVDADPPEALPDAAALTDWLRGRDLIDVDDRADRSDLDLALTLRSGLREAMVRHSEGDRTSRVPDLDAAATDLPLRIVFDGTRPRLAPAVDGVRGGLARLLVAIADAQADDTWAPDEALHRGRLRAGVLRHVEEPLAALVLDGLVRQPAEDPQLPRPSASQAQS